MRALVLAAAAVAALSPAPALAAECDPKSDIRCARPCFQRLDPAQAVEYVTDVAACLT